MSAELSALIIALAIVGLPALYVLVAAFFLRVLVEIAPGPPDAAAAGREEPRSPRRDLPRAA